MVGVGLHRFVAQAGMNEPQLLIHQFGSDIVGDAFAEDRDREPVGVAKIQHIVGGAKYRLIAPA